MSSCMGGWSEEEREEEPDHEDTSHTDDSELNSQDEQDQLEIALYSQIHYETAESGHELSLNGSLYHSDVSLVEKVVDTPDYKPKPVKSAPPSSKKNKKNRKKSSQFVSVTYEIDSKSEKKNTKKSKKLKEPVQYVIDTKGRTDPVTVSDSEDSVIVLPPKSPSLPPVVVVDDSDHWTFSDSKDTSDSDDSLSMVIGTAKAKPKTSLDLQFNFHKPAGFEDLEEILGSLGGDDDEWQIDASDYQQHRSAKSPRNSTMKRYYGNVNVQCHNCKERGHLSRDCMQAKKVQKCTMCGLDQHKGICKDPVCFSCLRLGHTQFECTEQKYPCRSRCTRCHRVGHDREDCSEWWRQFHVTTNPDVDIERGTGRRKTKRGCAYCGKQGHFVEDCDAAKYSRKVNHLPIFSPHVMCYDTLKQYENHVQSMIEDLSLNCPNVDEVKVRKNRRSNEVKVEKHRRSYSIGRGTDTSNFSQEPKMRSNGWHGRNGRRSNGYEFIGWQENAEEKTKGKKRKKLKGNKLFVSTESLVEKPKRKKKGMGMKYAMKQGRVRRHSLRLEQAADKPKTPS